MATLKENYFDHLNDDNIRICKIGDDVDVMWGMSCILLTTEQIKALLNGDCVWFTNEEYATVLRAETVEMRPVAPAAWIRNDHNPFCPNCGAIIRNDHNPFCPNCGAIMRKIICLK